MVLRSKPYDHILQLSTITCRHNNKLQRCSSRSARGNWDPRKDQQPFRPNPNWVGNRTTTLRLLLIGALNSPLRFNPTPTFLGVTFGRTLSFSKHVSNMFEGQVFPSSQGLTLYLCFRMGPLQGVPLSSV